MQIFPTISIITPSLNQGDYIEETILSVLSQGYPNIEYLVMDGCSSDNTLQILEKYAGRLKWISEPDKGQTNAINKGLQMTTGSIVGFLNADDTLAPGALQKIAESFSTNQDIKWVTGKCYIVNEEGEEIRRSITNYKNLLLRLRSFHLLFVTNYISQPATFWARTAFDELGPMDESLHYVMDYEYWLRLYSKYPPLFLPEYLAFFRVQRNSKTTRKGHSSIYIDEEKNIIQRYTSSYLPMFLHNTHRYIMTMIYSILNHR